MQKVIVTDDKQFPIHYYRNGQRLRYTLKAAEESFLMLSDAIEEITAKQVAKAFGGEEL